MGAALQKQGKGGRSPGQPSASNTLLLLVYDATLYGCVGSVATAKGTIIQQTRR